MNRLPSKIPANATKVFQGVIFEVFQWSQKMFDGSSATFEMLKRADTTQAIAVTTDKKIIVLDEHQPVKGHFISLPGGRVEPDEDLVQAMKRELLEETGYTFENSELFMSNRPYTKIDWNIYTFILKNCTKVTQQKLDPGEDISIKLYTFDEFIELALNNLGDITLQNLFLKAKLDPKLMPELRDKILG